MALLSDFNSLHRYIPVWFICMLILPGCTNPVDLDTERQFIPTKDPAYEIEADKIRFSTRLNGADEAVAIIKNRFYCKVFPVPSYISGDSYMAAFSMKVEIQSTSTAPSASIRLNSIYMRFDSVRLGGFYSISGEPGDSTAKRAAKLIFITPDGRLLPLVPAGGPDPSGDMQLRIYHQGNGFLGEYRLSGVLQDAISGPYTVDLSGTFTITP